MIDVTQYLNLARSIAGRVHRKWRKFPWEDMEAQAFFLLVDSADRFDPTRGVKFSTYASHRIFGKLREWARDEVRKASRRREVETHDNFDAADPENMIAAFELRTDLEAAITSADLTPIQRQTLYLVVVDGLPCTQTGTDRGVSLSAGTQSFCKAIKRVRGAYMGDYGNGEVEEGRPGNRAVKRRRHKGDCGSRSTHKQRLVEKCRRDRTCVVGGIAQS